MGEIAQRNDVDAVVMAISTPRYEIELEEGAAYAVVPGLLTYERRGIGAPFRRAAHIFADRAWREMVDQRPGPEKAGRDLRESTAIGPWQSVAHAAIRPANRFGGTEAASFCPSQGATGLVALRVSMATLEQSADGPTTG